MLIHVLFFLMFTFFQIQYSRITKDRRKKIQVAHEIQCKWKYHSSETWHILTRPNRLISGVDMTKRYHRWALGSEMYRPSMRVPWRLSAIRHWTSEIGLGMMGMMFCGSDLVRQTHQFSDSFRRICTYQSKIHKNVTCSQKTEIIQRGYYNDHTNL